MAIPLLRIIDCILRTPVNVGFPFVPPIICISKRSHRSIERAFSDSFQTLTKPFSNCFSGFSTISETFGAVLFGALTSLRSSMSFSSSSIFSLFFYPAPSFKPIVPIFILASLALLFYQPSTVTAAMSKEGGK